MEKFYISRLKAQAMMKAMQEPSYFAYLLHMENGPHSAIPISVGGDFGKSAPNGKKCLSETNAVSSYLIY